MSDLVVEPPVFVAVIVTEADEYSAVGVPVMAPVPDARLNPAGKVPLVTENVTTGPPLYVGAAMFANATPMYPE